MAETLAERIERRARLDERKRIVAAKSHAEYLNHCARFDADERIKAGVYDEAEKEVQAGVEEIRREALRSLKKIAGIDGIVKSLATKAERP